MEKLRIQNAYVTAFPHIFKETGWGIIEFRRDDQGVALMIENRTYFVKEYHIKRFIPCDKYTRLMKSHFNFKLCRSDLDHMEAYYSLRDTIVKAKVLVISPYGRDHGDKYIKAGWTKIPPIYNTSATSYIKILYSQDEDCL